MKVYEKNMDVISRRIAGELFLVPISGELANMQSMFALTSVAEFIWEKLDGQRNLRAIRDDVVARFEVERAQADSDVHAFVTELIAAGLVREAAS